ncbi:MAG: hypothetical protein COU29_01640 [Candidatus Magasanikbacteria bacterium CG10_big_fil_rev_8_21_14_0_10_36_32]|uniref:Uncharacterized protein n=1 Tax=Candidatus Magasanikbacteria bacterium CG10_big_fil_rev_8_21_14_0_10_36_32 TaxID=1974646 RepID=A0A2M6W6Q9_9BACT|nr:MAG: hypothetical protein COU29_01640 [Candidatus Magasanikbacteria bacterium CG10_big_fil_rev_8_21_14_0_10_36_32]
MLDSTKKETFNYLLLVIDYLKQKKEAAFYEMEQTLSRRLNKEETKRRLSRQEIRNAIYKLMDLGIIRVNDKLKFELTPN